MAPGKASTDELKNTKLFDVSHITALVTGGGTGIGLMITQALVANGAKVYITSRREEVLKKTEELHNHSNGEIIPLVGDVRYVLQWICNELLLTFISDPEDVKRLYKEISEKEPQGIQLLVNNAGIARDDKTKFSTAGEPKWEDAQSVSDHFLKSSPESWADTFKTNVGSIFYMSIPASSCQGWRKDSWLHILGHQCYLHLGCDEGFIIGTICIRQLQGISNTPVQDARNYIRQD